MKRQTPHLMLFALLCSACFLLFSSCAPTPPQTPGHRPKAEPTPSTSPDEVARSTPEWAYQQGKTALQQQKFDDAIQYFQATLQRDAMYLDAYIGLGDAYTQKGEYLVAESYYNKVLGYDPGSVPAYLALGNMSEKMGDYRKASSFYRKALEIEPGNATAQERLTAITKEQFQQYYEQGKAYQEAGDIEQALVEFQKAHSLKADDLDFTIEIGELFLAQKDYMMAEGYFQEALKTNPNYAPAIVAMGKAKLAQQQYDKAVEAFKQALAIEPGNQQAAEWLKKAQTNRIQDNLPPQYGAIAASPQVTRGEVAALLMVEFALENRLPAPSKRVIISDITTHWAKPYIIKAVQYDLIGLPPDRYFRPDEPMYKGELAQTLDLLLKKLGAALPSAPAGAFSDVYSDNQYAGAIYRVEAAGLMSASGDGTFGVVNPLSGAEMMQIMARVKEIVR